VTSRRRFLASASGALAAALWPARARAAADTFLLFSLNVQDFAYPEHSAALVSRALDLHEATGVPVDVSLTATQSDLFWRDFPGLFERLRVSPVACACYHVRPPVPYHALCDWLDVAGLDAGDQQALVRHYETHGLDLVSGQPTAADGGYTALVDRLGYAPPCVGVNCDAPVQAAADTVFADLGARFAVVHGRAANLGDRRNGLLVRPEHVDLKLFEYPGSDPGALIEAAAAQARTVRGARAPYVVGVKMHDNDFFAEDSAWLTVYASGHGRVPPWDLSRRSPLLDSAAADAMWRLYEGAVMHAAGNAARLPATSCRLL
jgi:hypothetical protein